MILWFLVCRCYNVTYKLHFYLYTFYKRINADDLENASGVIITVRRYASAVYTVIMYSVCHKSEFYEDG